MLAILNFPKNLDSHYTVYTYRRLQHQSAKPSVGPTPPFVPMPPKDQRYSTPLGKTGTLDTPHLFISYEPAREQGGFPGRTNPTPHPTPHNFGGLSHTTPFRLNRVEKAPDFGDEFWWWNMVSVTKKVGPLYVAEVLCKVNCYCEPLAFCWANKANPWTGVYEPRVAINIQSSKLHHGLIQSGELMITWWTVAPLQQVGLTQPSQQHLQRSKSVTRQAQTHHDPAT